MTLSRAIPTSIGPNPINPARHLMAEALISRRAHRPSFNHPGTLADAARAIDAELIAEIDAILSPLPEDSWSLSVSLLPDPTEAKVGALIALHDAYRASPDWLSDPAIADDVKSEIWALLGRAMPILLPVGCFDDLVEEISGYWWQGELDDDAAREAIAEMRGEELGPDDDFFLPSKFLAAQPQWTLFEPWPRPNDAPTPALPDFVAGPAAQVLKAMKPFRNASANRAAWISDFDITTDVAPEYGDAVSTPPIFLVPDIPVFNEALNDIGECAMQTSFWNVCGAAIMTSPKDIQTWLKSLAAGVPLLVALDGLLRATP